MEALIAAVLYKVHTVLTDNGIQFTLGYARLRLRRVTPAQYLTQISDRRCEENGIEHHPTQVKHPWTNEQSLPRRRPRSS